MTIVIDDTPRVMSHESATAAIFLARMYLPPNVALRLLLRWMTTADKPQLDELVRKMPALRN